MDKITKDEFWRSPERLDNSRQEDDPYVDEYETAPRQVPATYGRSGGARSRADASSFGDDIKTFIEMIAPGVISFDISSYIVGNTFRKVWAIRGYKTLNEEKAILRHLGEMDGVTLKIEGRPVSAQDENKIIDNAVKTNRMKSSNTDNYKEAVTATTNLEVVTDLLVTTQKNREPLFHVVAFIEIIADSPEQLSLKSKEVENELKRAGITYDKLYMRQQEGFLSVNPAGANCFKGQYERILPASSTANLFPFNYSGMTDANGFCIGKERFGSNIIVDFNKRTEDKTNANILILGNSGQGKSYLLKLILTCMREAGMNIICLDPELEYEELAINLDGVFVDLMSGKYMINVLEPKAWDDNTIEADPDVPGAFRGGSKLSQHISFLRDFFKTYKNFTDAQVDTIEIMLNRLYELRGITDSSDFGRLRSEDYPILSDLYDLIEKEYEYYDPKQKNLYTAQNLQEILLSLNSICKGADAKYFNGHTNITGSNFIVFGVKGLLQSSKNLKDAMLFNILSFMSNELLTRGNTVASVDEFYLFLSNLTAVEYIRNFSKRVRKKDSSVILASQNLEDFNIEGIKEYTKPLFAIPTHSFLFNAGSIDASFYKEMLQLEDSEYSVIQHSQRGTCLYRCGSERYNLEVRAPEYKAALFGMAGGR